MSAEPKFVEEEEEEEEEGERGKEEGEEEGSRSSPQRHPTCGSALTVVLSTPLGSM